MCAPRAVEPAPPGEGASPSQAPHAGAGRGRRLCSLIHSPRGGALLVSPFPSDTAKTREERPAQKG